MAHTFNPRAWDQKQEELFEFEASPKYIMSSRTPGMGGEGKGGEEGGGRRESKRERQNEPRKSFISPDKTKHFGGERAATVVSRLLLRIITTLPDL